VAYKTHGEMKSACRNLVGKLEYGASLTTSSSRLNIILKWIELAQNEV
jgi:hypothetical protein